MHLLSYNIASRTAPWELIMDSGVDVALIQEISRPPEEIALRIGVMGEPWYDVQGTPDVVWKSAVVRTSERVHVEWVRPHIAFVTELGCQCSSIDLGAV